MSIPLVKKLVAAGVVPGVAGSGRQIFPLEAVQILHAAPHCDLTLLDVPEVAVLRADAASAASETDRDWMGYQADLPSEMLLPALSGWWRCDPERVAEGRFMLVTVAEFVVAVLADLGEWDHNGGTRQALRYRFTGARLAGWVTDLTAPTSARFPHTQAPSERDLVAHLLGTRLPSVSGGPIAYVPAGPAAAHEGAN
ncbi:DNA-binding protein [Streptacidiphilus neutrinimicus]|uniref:DNA-binding protein n=1 Tax=Streptacidiphilus neutrinimicus TaxID=105420 RepID=UPI000ACF8D73|nr:DNA-binding protein [Streptacidiphilus neutrinimicus]